MPVHTRQLPTNSRKVLDELVEPHARRDGSTPDEAPSSANDREMAVPPEAVPLPRAKITDDTETRGLSDLPWYRREKWLAVQIAAIVPILGAMLVPETYRLPLCAIGGALVAVGTVMLLRHKPMPASTGSGST